MPKVTEDDEINLPMGQENVFVSFLKNNKLFQI